VPIPHPIYPTGQSDRPRQSSVSVIGVTLKDIALTTLDGKPTTLAELSDGATLVVNVASKCGLTPQYTALEKLAKDYGSRGLTVVGVPCNQFMGQEPGTADEIQAFCSTSNAQHGQFNLNYEEPINRSVVVASTALRN